MRLIYSDLNPFNPTQKPDLRDVEAIYASLFNILNTRKGERLFLPEFGVDLQDQLFELMDDITAVGVLREVIEGIEKFEPRVIIDSSRTTVTPKPDEGVFELVLAFELQGIESDGQTFEFRGALAA